MADRSVDILIVGGGLIGAALMLALSELNLSVLLIEAKPLSDKITLDFDARTLALAPASVRILQMLKAWSLLEPHTTPIKTIHVSEQHRFGTIRLQGTIDEALGHVVEMQHLNQGLHQLIDHTCVMAPAVLTAFDANNNIATVEYAGEKQTLHARLVVAADGANSLVREFCGLSTQIKDYKQVAVVANIGLKRSHHHCAYERFTAKGPLALLPMTAKRSALVWSLPVAEAQQLHNMPESEFLKQLQQIVGYRLGRFVKVGQRTLYPLRQVTLSTLISNSVVFIGNAAHTLHPIAGQGFNLGLRDVAMLAQAISQYGLNPEMLRYYQKSRQHDHTIITRSTDMLVELFQMQFPGIACTRSMGLIAFDNMPVLKKILSRYARGYAGIIPDLVCGIPLGSIHETSI